MAGPSIMVRVLADLTGLGKSVDGVGAKGSSAADKMHTAFRGVLDSLNQSGVLGPFGAALAGADSALETIKGHAKEIGPALMGAGAAVTGIGLALQAAGSKDAAAHQQLQAAVEATGQSYDDYSGRVEAAIKHQEKYGTTADETQDSLRALTTATNDPAKALDMLGTASDLAAAKHESLSTASGQLAKAANGSGRILKEFGITTKDSAGKTKDQSQIVGELAAKLTGQASASANTFTGHLKSMKAEVQDHIAMFGEKYGPAITIAGAAMTGLGASLEVAKGATQLFKEQQIAAKVATEAWAVAQWVLNVAMEANVVMIVVLAIVALIAIIVLCYAKVTWFRDAINDMGRIAVAAFNVIVDAAKAVWNWISQNWPLLLAILGGPFALVVLEIIKHRDELLGAIREIPGKVEQIATGMWDSILHAFRAMVNGIIDIWNGLHFTLPKIDAGPIHIGGEDIGVPKIPHLAQGGLITATGLIYAHAGEAITPAAAVGRTAPAVHVEHLEVSTELDVEAFMKRAAWVAQTAGM